MKKNSPFFRLFFTPSTPAMVALVGLTFFNGFTALAESEPTEAESFEEWTSVSETVSAPRQSPLDFALDLQFLPARYPNYSYAPGIQSDRYGAGARLGFEWLPLANSFGKAGFGGGIGYAKIRNIKGLDKAWLETFPLDLYMTYRFDYLQDQALVPFIKAGVERQYARQSAGNGLMRFNGWVWGAGLSLLLDRFDKGSAASLDSSIGINNTYLTVEYVNSQVAGTEREVNLAREEVRVGLRFEM